MRFIRVRGHMNTRIALPGWSAIALICAGCAPGSVGGPTHASISGTALYRERMMLPPDVVFEATLEDVSRADAPSEVLGQARIESPPPPPIKFTITYDPARIIANHRYVVRAKITRAGALMSTSDTAYPVLVPGKPDSPEILMRRVGSTAASGSANATLEGTEWKLLRLGAQSVTVTNPQNEPQLTLQASDKRASGSGGCNRFGGSYTLQGDQLKFGNMASTMMACAQGMEQERAFHQALASVARWRIEGRTLQLLDANGQVAATLEAKEH